MKVLTQDVKNKKEIIRKNPSLGLGVVIGYSLVTMNHTFEKRKAVKLEKY